MNRITDVTNKISDITKNIIDDTFERIDSLGGAGNNNPPEEEAVSDYVLVAHEQVVWEFKAKGFARAKEIQKQFESMTEDKTKLYVEVK